jgi:hypothetical protein
LLSFFLVRRCRREAGCGLFCGLLSNIAALQRNHFPLRELTGKSSLSFRRLPEGQEMSAGLFRIESAGAVDSGGFWGRPAARLFNSKLLWLAVILVVAAGAWKMSSEKAAAPAKGQTVGSANFARTASIQPAPLSDSDPASSASQSATAPAAGSPETAPVNGLRISSQSWRRGGLGSKALVTFTLRNDNDYAVGDIGLLCSFARADGSPVTERRPIIHDTVKMKSRKTFARMHVGFINVTASRAKCTLLSASRV